MCRDCGQTLLACCQQLRRGLCSSALRCCHCAQLLPPSHKCEAYTLLLFLSSNEFKATQAQNTRRLAGGRNTESLDWGACVRGGQTWRRALARLTCQRGGSVCVHQSAGRAGRWATLVPWEGRVLICRALENLPLRRDKRKRQEGRGRAERSAVGRCVQDGQNACRAGYNTERASAAHVAWAVLVASAGQNGLRRRASTASTVRRQGCSSERHLGSALGGHTSVRAGLRPGEPGRPGDT